MLRALTFSIETVHHALHDVYFVLDGEVNEVGVDEDVVRRAEVGVVLEEQRRRRLRSEKRVEANDVTVGPGRTGGTCWGRYLCGVCTGPK